MTARRHMMSLLAVALLLLALYPGCGDVNDPTGEVSGFVFDSSGKPIANALVRAETQTTGVLTSNTGGYFFSNLPFGPQKITASKNGFDTKSTAINVFTNKNVSQVNFSLTPNTFEIINFKTIRITGTTLEFSFNTTATTKSRVLYGLDQTLGRATPLTSEFAKSHNPVITNLSLETTYFLQIEAQDTLGFTRKGAVFTLTTRSTLDDQGPPETPRVVQSFFGGQGAATIAWTPATDVDLAGYKIYRSDSAIGNFALLNNSIYPKGKENYKDVGLKAGRKYFYRVTAVDFSGNESGPSHIVEFLIPGLISENITWSLANSPYDLQGDLQIPSNLSLTIDPGVVVNVRTGDLQNLGSDTSRIEIINDGVLSVRGTTQSPILFQVEAPATGRNDWSGIRLSDSAVDSLTAFDHCRFANAKIAITATKTALNLRNSEFFLCERGVDCDQGSNLLILQNSFTDVTQPIRVQNSSSTTIQLNTLSGGSTHLELSQNLATTVRQNSLNDFTDLGILCDDASGTMVVRNNLLSSLAGTGVRIKRGVVDAQYVTIDAPRGVQIVGGRPGFSNSILAGSRGRGILGFEFSASGTMNPLPSYSDIFNFDTLLKGVATGTGMVHLDPKFVGGAPFDYHLTNDPLNDPVRRGSSDNTEMGYLGGRP